jgi:GT2 family glycosyltransferase
MTNKPQSGPPDAPPLVTVVIVNYNGGELVCQSISALKEQRFLDFMVVVVDNNSSDGSVASIRTQHPSVVVLEPGSNLGFAGGVNHALRECRLGSWVALLNPDAFPSPDWLGNLMIAAKTHLEYATFGSKMFRDEDQLVLDGVGDAYHVSGLPWRKAHGSQSTAQYDQEIEIFAPCAAAALYRTDALKSVGLFDEDFFLYVEDVDIGFRLRLAGYRALYVPTASVRHIGSAFVGKHSEFQIYHGHRNLVWVYIKNMPGLLFWVFLPLHLGLNLVSILWFSLRGNAGVILRAKRDALRGLPHYWMKRKLVQSNRKVSDLNILRHLTWNPFSR